MPLTPLVWLRHWHALWKIVSRHTSVHLGTLCACTLSCNTISVDVTQQTCSGALLRVNCPYAQRAPDMELGHWVTGSVGHLGHLSRPGHWVTGSSF